MLVHDSAADAHLLLLVGAPVDARAVLGAHVVLLAVQRRSVVRREEFVYQLLVCDLGEKKREIFK